MSDKIGGRGIWYCKIGECDRNSLPQGCDWPMRRAVEEAYLKITGSYPQFIFSGWSAELTKVEEDVLVHQAALKAAGDKL